MDKLLDDVKGGRLDISTVGGAQYQQLVFEQLLRYLFMDPHVLTVENHLQGPVDYVVREPTGTGMLDKRRKHYFECKNYSRTLELDNVAKIMVVAIADQPDSVHVVSRTRLQPQISIYASRLFDVGTSGDPIFRSIAFRHWRTDQLLNFDKTCFPGRDKCVVEKKIAERETSWWLTECSAFSETEIACSDQSNQKVQLRRGCLLLLTLELPERKGGYIELIGIPDNSWFPITPTENDQSALTGISYLIDTRRLESGMVYHAIVKVTSGVVDTRIPLGELRVGNSETLLPELRQEEVQRFFHQIGPSGEYRLVLVEGEAGVGKTYFIEKTAEELRAKCGFDVMCFTVTEENQGTVLSALLRGCLTPPIDHKSFKEVAAAVQSALLSKEAADLTLETDVNLLARVAIRMGPRVIVLRDCQNLSEQVVNQLWTLIIAFNDSSWGGLRLILEYRQPEASSNSALRSLILKINVKIRKVLLTKPMLPLNDRQLSGVAVSIFRSITTEITECLMQRTGGLPLFIESYLRRLLDIGFIARDQDNPSSLSICQPARLLADTLPLNGALILEQRIRTWLQDKFGDESNILAIELGLIAVADDSLSQLSIREALHISNERIRTIQRALDVDNLGSGRPDGQIIFRHDLFRSAIISVAKSVSSFENIARELADKLVKIMPSGNNLRLRFLRARIFTMIGDRVALETELRLGSKAAQDASDYGALESFLSQLLAILSRSSNIEERFDLMNGLAWAAWVSDSLLVARERYLQLAEEAQQNAIGDFTISEAVATDAYRRIIGIDLELMEPTTFLKTAIVVLKRRQTLITFNSIMNRLVLFCARFSYPKAGFDFSELALNYIGDGRRGNEGAVLCSEMGALYALAEPEAALSLFRSGLELASDDVQRSYNLLDIIVLESLHKGLELDLELFDQLWKTLSQKRFSEILTRASLLRGSLFLRAGDLRSARHWIKRTSTMVNLFHLKEFELPILNDQLLLSVLEGNFDLAKNHLVIFAEEFELIHGQREVMTSLLPELFEECHRAAEKLPPDPSPLSRPNLPPPHCNVFSEMWGNIAVIASKLDLCELTTRYSMRPAWMLDNQSNVVNEHRHVKFWDSELVLGAY